MTLDDTEKLTALMFKTMGVPRHLISAKPMSSAEEAWLNERAFCRAQRAELEKCLQKSK